jgi:phosphoenolpyruvate carboxykinase (ATP)
MAVPGPMTGTKPRETIVAIVESIVGADPLDALLGQTPNVNVAPARLIELALAAGEGQLAANGALTARTGERTGRSPNDKFFVDAGAAHDEVCWGKINQPISGAHYAVLRSRVLDHLGRRERYVFNGFACADTSQRLAVRTVTEKAWHSLFIRNLLIRPTPQELAGFAPQFTILNACTYRAADYKELGLRSPVFILVNLESCEVLIAGTEYAGEMKKSVFTVLNYLLPRRGVLPMHCSANVGSRGDLALFFGLSGTGKTTLSADPARPLIGDDEHGWGPNGVFNFEGGCYAKCVGLSREKEPQIFDAVRFGSVLENVVVDPTTRQPDYTNISLTENTRAAYPLDFMPNTVTPSVGPHPTNILFLAADASGVLPPISRLSTEQGMYHFISGYTSKTAGTETGINEPQATFSACFGQVFLPLAPKVYAGMLGEMIHKHKVNIWLVNTGWSGGGYGLGHRMSLKVTRALVTAALDGTLANGSFSRESYFGLELPNSCPGVPAEILHPEKAWADRAAYGVAAALLVEKFRRNDAAMDLPEEIRRAGPG